MMNKREFLYKIEKKIKDLPQSDITEVIEDYNQHFDEAKKQGRSDEEVAKALGDPNKIVRQIKSEFMIERAEKNRSTRNIFRAVLATATLGFFNLVFIIGPFIGVLGTLIGIAATVISIVASGIVAILVGCIGPFSTLVEFSIHPLVIVFGGIAVTAFGLLLSIGTFYLFKLFYKLTIGYLKFNFNLIKQDK